jgi:putative ABC transport system permease protein
MTPAAIFRSRILRTGLFPGALARTALRNVLAHKGRLLMTMLAVLLGTAFVSGTLVFTDTVAAAYTGSSRESFDHVDVRIRSAATGDSAGTARLLGRDLLDRTRNLPGAASATGVASGFAALAGRDAAMVGEGRATIGAGHDGVAGPGARHPMAAGRAPRAEGEIAIDATTAERTGYGVGDTVRLSVSGPVRIERVTGVFTTTDGNVAAGGTLTLFDPATAQRLFAAPGRYNQIDLAAAPGTTAEELRREAGAVLPHGAEAVTAARLGAEQANRNAANVTMLSQVLLACAGIALFVAVFLIVNTFTMLITGRTRELALLRAVGATRRQVIRSVLIEAAIVGLVAATAGLLLGVGAGAGVRAVLSATGGELPDGPLVVRATTVVVSLALGAGVTVLAAWLPARHAAKIPPVAALTSAYAPPATRGLVVRGGLGAVLAAAGTALVITATAMKDGKIPMALGAALLLTGVFVLTPLLSRPMIAVAGPVLRRFGISGRLAGRNAVRDPRRTAATASALTIGLTLITGLTVIGTSADRTIEKLAASDYMRGDYIVTMAGSGPLAPDTGQKLDRLAEVTASSPRRVTRARVDGVDQEVTGFKTQVIGGLMAFDFVAGSYAPGATAVVDDGTAADRGWRLGDTLAVTWPDGARGELKITGIYRSNFDDGVKTDVSVIDPHLDRGVDTSVFVKTRGGPSEETERILRRALGDSPAIRISDKQDLVRDFTGVVGIVLNVLFGMLALAVVVAVLGVVNTLAMSVHERAREIGMLRAVGLDRPGVGRIVRLESLVISLFGGVLGAGLGVFLAWAAGEVATDLESLDTWTFVLPWGRLALILAAAALVGVVAALWPARRAARLDILTAIKTE